MMRRRLLAVDYNRNTDSVYMTWPSGLRAGGLVVRLRDSISFPCSPDRATLSLPAKIRASTESSLKPSERFRSRKRTPPRHFGFPKRVRTRPCP
jgi:hypothetical protein